VSYHRRPDCRLCGCEVLTQVLALVPTPPANALLSATDLKQHEELYPLDVFQCTRCGHVQLTDIVDPSSLFRHYLYVSATSPVFTEHLERYAIWAIDRFGVGDNNLMVEFGSNDGTLLGAFKRRGMAVLGVEPARNLADKASEQGLETLPEFFTRELARDIRRQRGPAHLIIANNVFAHADGLVDMAEGVRDLLAPDGVFIFEVGYLLDVFEKSLFDTIYHEHLSYHTVAPLKGFFQRLGLKLFDAMRVDSQGGSIRCMVELEDGPYAEQASLGELIELERAAQLDSPAGMLSYATKLADRKRELTTLLSTLKDEGRSVAAFGAPAKCTTLLHYFGIDGDTIEYIIEDNPLKQGLFTPGFHIPIVAPQRMIDSRPDFVVILAWNFADSIIARHKDFLAQGGHFIVPLPTVRIV
jgi:SAM-dependent methyltransferase